MRKKIISIVLGCALASASLPAMAIASIPHAADNSLTGVAVPSQKGVLQLSAARMSAEPVQVALVDSCSDAWYWRSLIEEFACGFSGQGWIN
ncbi:hypothetical protein ACXHMN_29385 [Rhizobium sp. LEGMi12c]